MPCGRAVNLMDMSQQQTIDLKIRGHRVKTGNRAHRKSIIEWQLRKIALESMREFCFQSVICVIIDGRIRENPQQSQRMALIETGNALSQIYFAYCLKYTSQWAYRCYNAPNMLPKWSLNCGVAIWKCILTLSNGATTVLAMHPANPPNMNLSKLLKGELSFFTMGDQRVSAQLILERGQFKLHNNDTGTRLVRKLTF